MHGYRVEHQHLVPAHELPIHLREQCMEFVGEYYDMYYVLPQMTIYYKSVTWYDLLGWANTIGVIKALADHAATRVDIAPCAVDYFSNLLEPHMHELLR